MSGTTSKITNTVDNLWREAQKLPLQGWELMNKNKGRTAVVIGAVSLTAAYLVFPAYAAYVNAYAAKSVAFVAPAISGISGGFAAMFIFAAAHPLSAGLVAVAAMLTISALACKNIMQTGQVNQLTQENDQLTQENDQLTQENDQLIQEKNQLTQEKNQLKENKKQGVKGNNQSNQADTKLTGSSVQGYGMDVVGK